MTRSIFITWNGMTKNKSEWAAYFGISGGTLRERMALGVPFEDMDKRRHRGRAERLITWNGLTLNMKDWAAHLGIGKMAFRGRYEAGLSMEEITKSRRVGRPKGAKDKKKRKAGTGLWRDKGGEE